MSGPSSWISIISVVDFCLTIATASPCFSLVFSPDALRPKFSSPCKAKGVLPNLHERLNLDSWHYLVWLTLLRVVASGTPFMNRPSCSSTLCLWHVLPPSHWGAPAEVMVQEDLRMAQRCFGNVFLRMKKVFHNVSYLENWHQLQWQWAKIMQNLPFSFMKGSQLNSNCRLLVRGVRTHLQTSSVSVASCLRDCITYHKCDIEK